jgi:hypothetical protein
MDRTAYKRKYRDEHRDAIAISRKKWETEHPCYHREHREKNKQKALECEQKYREKNRQKLLEYQRQYRKKHSKYKGVCLLCGAQLVPHKEIKYCRKCYPIHSREYFKEYYSRPENKTAKSLCWKKYRQKNLENEKERFKRYYENNIERMKIRRLIFIKKRPEYFKEYGKHISKHRRDYLKRYRAKISVKLNLSMRSVIGLTLKGNKKGRHWEFLVGYTCEELKTHLEKQFTKKMNWENYGKYWHIDHRIPKSWFIFESTDDPEFKRCWALENLQPKPGKENMRKNSHYAEPTIHQILNRNVGEKNELNSTTDEISKADT